MKMNLFIAIDGNDKNIGSIDAPLATLDEAVKRIEPGGTIYFRGGIYLNKDYAKPWDTRTKGSYCRITKCGLPMQPIMIQNYRNERVIVQSDVGGLSFSGAKHWIIRGIQFQGGSPNIDYETAINYWWHDGLSPISGRGISLAESSTIFINDCVILNFPGAGISNNGGSDIYVTNCIIGRCAWWSTGGVHGFANSAPAGNGDIVAENNLFFGNQSNIISHVFSKKVVKLEIDEGNGLHCQNDQGLWSGTFRAKNNLLMYNGKAGIGLNTCSGAVLANNTFVENAQNTNAGNLTLQSSAGVIATNNVFQNREGVSAAKVMGDAPFALDESNLIVKSWAEDVGDAGVSEEIIFDLMGRRSQLEIEAVPCPHPLHLDQQIDDILERWPEQYAHIVLVTGEGKTYTYQGG
jgi:hypothetical protein